MLTDDQVRQLRDDGAIILSLQYADMESHNGRVDLMNTLAQRGHALPFAFTDDEAVTAYMDRRRAFLNTHEDTVGSEARVPRIFTEREPVPIIGFYATTDDGRRKVLRVHPDDRVPHAWELGQRAAEHCLSRETKRSAYHVLDVHHG